MNIILLSGGSGKRLWPLSNDIRSKQFLKLFKNRQGQYESMLQRIYRQIKEVDENINITIATSKKQVSAIHNQLSGDVGICVEPCRRDTFPAIALATSYLHDVKKVGSDEAVVVCPVDSYVEDDYFVVLKRLSDIAKEGDANISLIGIEPTYPSEKYGYIIPENQEFLSKVNTFKEKPDKKTAGEYIAQGALWNGGVFAYKLGYMLKKMHELIEFQDYYDLYSRYETLDKISFDYAVLEQEENINVMRYSGAWKDLGTWNTLTETMQEKAVGSAFLDDSCENVHIVNELGIPVLCMGLSDVVVAASPDGILVSDKEKSSAIKTYVENLNQDIKYAEKSWGDYKVVSIGEHNKIVELVIKENRRMSYHSHALRDEIWIVVSGEGRTVVDGMEQFVKSGDVITIKAGRKHTIYAGTQMRIIEVQLGEEISQYDKQKFTLE